MQIVNFYRKHSAGKVSKDSNLQHIFNTLDTQLDQLDKATPNEAKAEEDLDTTKLGFHHIDLIDNKEPYIVVVEEVDYEKFVNIFASKVDSNYKTLDKKITEYISKLPVEKAIDMAGIYRTLTLKDFSVFDFNSYSQKI
jgi:hypothetical protein